MGLLLILVSDILGRIAVSLVRVIMMINDKSLRQIMLVMQMAMAMITINTDQYLLHRFGDASLNSPCKIFINFMSWEFVWSLNNPKTHIPMR